MTLYYCTSRMVLGNLNMLFLFHMRS
uniref:Uncharacterized protein n=1 Tax=Arundo donax TaxID=35708 RepID=A0A0A9BLY8_ARUDO